MALLFYQQKKGSRRLLPNRFRKKRYGYSRKFVELPEQSEEIVETEVT